MLGLTEASWAGTDASLQMALDIEARMRASGPDAFSGGDVPAPDYLLQQVGSVGIISIKGPLVNVDNWMTQYLGMSTYPAIRQALISAAKNESIKQIMLSIDSGGGSVSGVVDTGDLIARIASQVKPVTAFAEGTMASAAYWLGVSGGKVYVSSTTLAGSVGVITTHVDRTKQLAQDGIKATVLRAGKYKALANPLEPLSDAARAQIQSQLDAAYTIFAQHVADSRGVTYAVADTKMGQGREFFGNQAVEAGLVDGVSSFDAIVSQLQSTKAVDKPNRLYDNGIHKNKRSAQVSTKPTLTEQDIATLALGAAVAGPAAAAVVEPVIVVEPVVAVVTEPVVAAVVEPVVAAPAVAAPAAPAADAGVVAYLQAQAKEKDDALLALNIQIAAMTAKAADIEATHTPLLQIARDSISKMQVALGGSAVDMSSLTAVAVLAEHARVQGVFTTKFKVGGVAVTAPVDAEKTAAAAPSGMASAKLAAVRGSKK